MSVTLSAAGTDGTATYGEVTATTATNTLIIGKGVTIETLTIDGGNVIIEEGATVNTITNNVTGNTITRRVKTSEGLISAIGNVLEGNSTIVEVVEDITDLDADNTIVIPNGKTLVLDLNNHTVSGISDQTGANRNMFTVKGTLTVKNGTMTLIHVGADMEWANSTNVFDVTAGGVLNIESATIENLGGSDMAFCVHLNNWGEVTLNVTGSILNSTYIPLRVFNSGNDMNNVSISSSTLESTAGNRVLWVHNFTAVDLGAKYDKEAVEARLNFEIFNQGNTFIVYDTEANRLVEYGFTNAINFDKDGNFVARNASALAYAFENGIDVKLGADFDLTSGITVPAEAEITLDLNGKNLTGSYRGGDHYAMFTILYNASLTVTGSGNVSATTEVTEDNRSLAIFQNAGQLTLEGDDYHIDNTRNDHTWIIATIVDNRTTSTSCTTRLTIDGGEYSVGGDATNLFRNYPQQGGTVTLIINDGTFKANESVTTTYIWNQESGSHLGELYFNGGTYDTKVVYEDYNGQDDVHIAEGVQINAYSGNS